MSTITLLLTLLLQAPAVSPESLADDVGKLAAATDNEQRFDALAGMLKAHNIAFAVEPFTIDKPVGAEPRTSGRNIVVTFGEGGDTIDTILVGAHYDAARLRDGSLSRGAVDNAASSVMLVRLAEALLDDRPQVRIRIVWFDMEELGLLGSARYLEAHASDRVRAMINFDINAYGDTILFGAPAGGEHAGLRKAMLETCGKEEVDCIRFPRMPPGDDRNFGKAAIPTLSIAILPAAEVHQLWLLLEGGAKSGLAEGTAPAIMRTIHTPDDVPAKVDGAAIARMHRFAGSLVRRLSASF
jgi:acetylornithine deacetylase/succinyl-diaminopimelate desuccinylase-like protein